MPLALNFPSWLKPQIIPGLPIRWYGLMYLLAFLVTYLMFKLQVKRRKLDWDEDLISGLFFSAILGLLLGARIFAVFVYDTSGIYLTQPWLIFWPFHEGRFIGLQGMSYHGGLIGTVIAVVIYCRRKKLNTLDVGDMLVAGIPLGFTFGRLGNFINGELYGRVTSSPLGMIFPEARLLSSSKPWVRQIADQTGIAYSGLNTLVNLPRHPSQLYEALFEGVVLWVVLWFLAKRKPFKGFVIGAYLIGFGTARFIIEYLREPDPDLGYRIELVKTGLPPAIFSSPFNFSTGQILCFLMVVAGVIWLAIASALNRKALLMANKVESTSETKNTRRKVRKKLSK